jgi:hypothetical protein
MDICSKISTNRVLFDEGFFGVKIIDDYIDDYQDLHANQIAFVIKNESLVKVFVEKCDLCFGGDQKNKSIFIEEVVFLIKKNIVVQTDSGKKITKSLTDRKCLSRIELAKKTGDLCPFNERGAFCQVQILDAKDYLEVTGDGKKIHEKCIVDFVVKIVEEDQMIVACCPNVITALIR